jgi:hypothetical protein
MSSASHHLYHPVSMYLSQKQNTQHRACQTWGRGLWSQNKTARQMFTWLYITMQIYQGICRGCFNKQAGKKHKFTWNYSVSMFPSIDIGKLIPWCNHAKTSRKKQWHLACWTLVYDSMPHIYCKHNVLENPADLHWRACWQASSNFWLDQWILCLVQHKSLFNLFFLKFSSCNKSFSCSEFRIELWKCKWWLVCGISK